MAPQPGPSMISLEWDYGSRPILVDRLPGFPPHRVRFLDPFEIGLSDGLAEHLEQWRDQRNALAARCFGDIPEEQIDDLRLAYRQLTDGLHRLARDVARELGLEVTVELYRGRVPLQGHPPPSL